MFDPASNIRFTGGKDNTYRKSSVDGKSQKDFQKVFSKEEKDERKFGDEKETVKEKKGDKLQTRSDDAIAGASKKEEIGKKGNISLFDLAKEPGKGESGEIVVARFPDEMHDESLSALFKGYGTKEKLKSLLTESDMEKKVLPGNSSERENVVSGLLEKERNASRFTSQEQPDLSSINPMAGVVVEHEAGVRSAEAAKPAHVDLQEIIDQIVQKIYTLKVDGRTDTVITLKHPPLFNGANLVITGFDSARGELNIAFENLTQRAKMFLDMSENQNSLRLALENKGLTVHIMTATTISETIPLAKSEESRGKQEEQGGYPKGQQQKQDEEAEG